MRWFLIAGDKYDRINGNMDVPQGAQMPKLPENKNLKIILLVVVILAVGAGAYFYLTNISDRTGVQEDLPEFIIEDSKFILGDGEVRVKPQIPDDLIVRTVVMLGRIEEDPVLDGVTRETKILISFRRADGKPVLTNINLGLPNRSVGTHIASGGLIGLEKEWRGIRISEISPLLKKNDPIFVYLSVDDISREFFEDERCTDICQDVLQEIKDNFENNSLLISAIRGEVDASVETLTVGSVSQIVIYGE